MFLKSRSVSLTLLFVSTLGHVSLAQSTENRKTTFRDLAYVSDGHELQKLDLFLPEKGKGPFPLVIWIHGGAWLQGSKEKGHLLRAGYQKRGYAVASINYRLSQHAIFPAQIQDCKAAIRWLRANANKYNLETSKFGVSGSSAGGHLVALLGTSGGLQTFDVGENLDQSSNVQAVCDLYGPTDFVQMDAHALTGAKQKHNDKRSPESRLIGASIQDPANYAKVQAANPIKYVDAKDAPFLIIHGNADPLVPHHQSELLYNALNNAGVPVHFITVVGGGHGKGFPYKQLNPQIAAFFDRHLKGKRATKNDAGPKTKTSTVDAISPQ